MFASPAALGCSGNAAEERTMPLTQASSAHAPWPMLELNVSM
jgi:hypothetical protein